MINGSDHAVSSKVSLRFGDPPTLTSMIPFTNTIQIHGLGFTLSSFPMRFNHSEPLMLCLVPKILKENAGKRKYKEKVEGKKKNILKVDNFLFFYFKLILFILTH